MKEGTLMRYIDLLKEFAKLAFFPTLLVSSVIAALLFFYENTDVLVFYIVLYFVYKYVNKNDYTYNVKQFTSWLFFAMTGLIILFSFITWLLNIHIALSVLFSIMLFLMLLFVYVEYVQEKE